MSGASLMLTLALLGSSAPYVRTKVDTGITNDPNAHCFYWNAGTVTFNQSAAGNAATPGQSEFDAVSAAWQSWRAIMTECGSLSLIEGPRVSDRTIGYDQENPGDNRNVILFRPDLCANVVPSGDACRTEKGGCGNKYDCWSLGYSKGTIALTTTTYDVDTGVLYDADVEFNAGSFLFTTVNSPPCSTAPYSTSCVAYDVQNTMTHEAGHFLGLDHTDNPGSTMNPTAPVGETSKRQIDTGSHDFVCEVYPKGKPAVDCVQPKPKQGCCAVGGEGLAWQGGVMLLALLGLQRRRRG